MSNYREQIRAIIADKLSVSVEEITDEKTFGDLGADSLDAVELVMEFEKEFNIAIPDEEAEAMTSVGKVMEIIIRKIEGK